MFSRIVGTGSHLPSRCVSNADLEKMVDTSDEWIRTRTGIKTRYLLGDDESNLDLAEGAVRNAMEMAGVGPDEVDLIIVGTTTPEQVFPNMGCLLQQRLDIHDCPAFSLEAACTGFVYALSVADMFIKTGGAKCAVVVGSETLSSIVDWTDRQTCVLFGDGAGAVVLKPSEEPGILSTHLSADGKYGDLLYVSSGVSKGFEGSESNRDYVQMRGNDVFKVAVRTLGKIAQIALDHNDMSTDELTWLVPHQANIRIIQAAAKKLSMPMEKVIQTVQDHGNTSAASVPLALDTGVRDGRIKRGDTLLLEAFGGGFTWGSALIKY
ncbi:MAG: ketoacyl-ACP synthase III [Gammaproteobacteria bacterium]|nr:ketoacyl-ACP synthase III [Gammaproteobacteria bacterium]